MEEKNISIAGKSFKDSVMPIEERLLRVVIEQLAKQIIVADDADGWKKKFKKLLKQNLCFKYHIDKFEVFEQSIYARISFFNRMGSEKMFEFDLVPVIDENGVLESEMLVKYFNVMRHEI